MSMYSIISVRIGDIVESTRGDIWIFYGKVDQFGNRWEQIMSHNGLCKFGPITDLKLPLKYSSLRDCIYSGPDTTNGSEIVIGNLFELQNPEGVRKVFSGEDSDAANYVIDCIKNKTI